MLEIFNEMIQKKQNKMSEGMPAIALYKNWQEASSQSAAFFERSSSALVQKVTRMDRNIIVGNSGVITKFGQS